MKTTSLRQFLVILTLDELGKSPKNKYLKVHSAYYEVFR
jgi:hypothetical protein